MGLRLFGKKVSSSQVTSCRRLPVFMWKRSTSAEPEKGAFWRAAWFLAVAFHPGFAWRVLGLKRMDRTQLAIVTALQGCVTGFWTTPNANSTCLALTRRWWKNLRLQGGFASATGWNFREICAWDWLITQKDVLAQLFTYAELWNQLLPFCQAEFWSHICIQHKTQELQKPRELVWEFTLESTGNTEPWSSSRVTNASANKDR